MKYTELDIKSYETSKAFADAAIDYLPRWENKAIRIHQLPEFILESGYTPNEYTGLSCLNGVVNFSVPARYSEEFKSDYWKKSSEYYRDEKTKLKKAEKEKAADGLAQKQKKLEALGITPSDLKALLKSA